MEFSPKNNIVRLCLQGMGMEEKGKTEEASKLFLQAWNEATHDLEKFISAHFIARSLRSVSDKLKWLQTALQIAQRINDETVKSAFPSLYSSIAKCHEELHDSDQSKKYSELAKSFDDAPSDQGPFYHGTKADLRVGDLLSAGENSNYKSELKMNHIYFTALVHGAGLAAEMAEGDGRERVYVVEPLGPFENDPNVTNKKFPGNPTRSYRSPEPLRIIGEVTDWARQTPDELKKWREKVTNNSGEIIN
jgi:rifampin ADP-ribosylating transferase